MSHLKSYIIKAFLLLNVIFGPITGGCGSAHDTSQTKVQYQPTTIESNEISNTMVSNETEAQLSKVTIDLHIMSKCPYAVTILRSAIPVVKALGQRVELKIHYIGKGDYQSLSSMHGQEEIIGDILQLCARNYGDTNAWLNFIKCQIQEWRQIPLGWERCASSTGLDVAKLVNCYSYDEGHKLLEKSFQLSENAGATGSPTMFLNGELYKAGRSEEAIARRVCALLESNIPPYCADLPAPIKVPVIMIADNRCTGRGCGVERFSTFITQAIEGAEIEYIDYTDEKGKALYEASKQQYLPIAIFGEELANVETAYNRLKRRLVQLPETGQYVYPLGRAWDPTSEICDDKIDNTGNGKIDCKDKACKGKFACKKEVKRKLELFLMSQCPYAAKTVEAIYVVIKEFNNNKKNIKFSLSYIGQERDGVLTSMHGEKEIAEDKRQICVQKYYKKNYQFMDYVACRAHDYLNENWQNCAVNGIDANVIEKCANGIEGEKLLAASFKRSANYNVTGSPSWILNNKYIINARTPETIKEEFCKKNSNLKACKN